MKKILIFILFLQSLSSFSQTIAITANPGTSGNIGTGTSNYHVSEYIYTDAEIGANFTTAVSAINRISLNCTTVSATSSPAFANFRILMKETTASTLATGTYNTTGYTVVFTGTLNIVSGWNEVVMTTPFQRTPGQNLQVMFERTDNLPHLGFVYASANGNNTSGTAVTSRRYNGTTALSSTTSLATSAFRLSVRLKCKYNNDVVSEAIYTLGKLPTPNGTSAPLSASVLNDGLNPLTNFDVIMTVSGANTFSNTQTVASLAPGARTTVTFPGFNPTVKGTNTLSVNSNVADDYSINNTVSVQNLVNNNTWSYAYGPISNGGVGFSTSTGDFVAKFNTNVATQITQVTVNFNAGGQPYKLGIWDATGPANTPGTLLWESATQTSATGVNVLPVNPIVSIPIGDFFVGVRQTAAANVSFSYQTESPIRPSTFYFTSPSGSSTWTDFAPNSPFRFMIEPKMILPIDGSLSDLIVPKPSCHDTSSYVVKLTNTGANDIAPNGATVTLKIGGANSISLNQTNSLNLSSGQTETFIFSGVNIANLGTNLDTAFVTLSSDAEPENDRQIRSNLTLNDNEFIVESFENAINKIGLVEVVAGNRNLTTFPASSYNNIDLGTLIAKDGSKMVVFDNYGGASSIGVVNRLYSECITIAVDAASPTISFYMSHDTTFLTDLDSVYVSVSEDKGKTWVRLEGFQRYDPTYVTGVGWEKISLSLTDYLGKTIQIGFENVSKYGNIIALDKIVVSSDCRDVIVGTDSEEGSLRNAIDCSALTDVIVIDPSVSTITLTAPLGIVNKNLTIQDADMTPTIITLDSDVSNLNISPTGIAILDNLHIKDLSVTKAMPVLINDGTLTLKNTKVSGETGSMISPTVKNNGTGTVNAEGTSTISNQ
jgi:hypothetical protein